jgi:hypothetical protein
MANVLSKSGITNASTIQAWHVSQSVDALTAVSAYDITISGSLTVTGSTNISGSVIATTFTGSLLGTASYASRALTSSYATSASYALSSSYAVSASYALSSSYAFNSTTASYINPASVIPLKLAPSYLMVGSATYPPSTPYAIQGPSSTNIYISASSTVGLQFTSTNVTDGQIINFNPFWLFPSITTATVAITASVNVYGIGGGTNLVLPGTPKTLDQIGVAPTIKSFTFQYIATLGVGFPAAGWYLINVNES